MNKKFLALFLLFLVGTAQSSMAQFYPQSYSRHIEINIPAKTLRLIQGNTILREYPISVGKSKEWMTPIGNFNVIEKTKNPLWINPIKGTKIGPGKNNPLGTRWIGFYKNAKGQAFGIHGTNDPSSIGKFISHGCVRMKPRDIEEVYDFVGIGTSVNIVYNRVVYKQNPYGEQVIVNVHPDPYGLQPIDEDE
ncbi:MAG: L,D-transpeptidase [Candidatus Caenarcaniphilales bacterium]|nr:L,D-transpeptidase [Candidatus Caenarcaniphilales bacterium]